MPVTRYHPVVMHARDTSPEAAAVQYEAYRRIGPSGRFAAAAELTNVVRELARTGIRMRHPEYTVEEISKEFVSIVYRQNPDRRED
jgi:hypothetical protein